MQPLIEELKELWVDSIMTYDASVNQMFSLHKTLLWTISDFPAYAMLSGKSTKGHRLRRYKVSFNGKIELETKPPTLDGIDVLSEFNDDGVLTEYKKEDIKKRLEERVDKNTSSNCA
ncbi:hypothetical protein LIER_19533 [Lithospermum erythrorhizon]|uniref:Uncharacterized protein n=1 Tax=Lithospermum erythrorhizon TaxID=34254 RepID=A0AAV3QI45_LITER